MYETEAMIEEARHDATRCRHVGTVSSCYGSVCEFSSGRSGTIAVPHPRYRCDKCSYGDRCLLEGQRLQVSWYRLRSGKTGRLMPRGKICKKCKARPNQFCPCENEPKHRRRKRS